MPFDLAPAMKPSHPARPNPVVEVLQRAKELIATPDKWCRGALYDSGARCILGALHNYRSGNINDCDDHGNHDAAISGYMLLSAAAGNRPPSFFNNDDTTTHADVLALFDRAIAKAEQS